MRRDEPIDASAAFARLRANVDERPEVQSLFKSLRASMPELEKLLEHCNSHWGHEDGVYRFYHQSFKVYGVQALTTRIVAALQALAPDRKLNVWFVQIVSEGTGKKLGSSTTGNGSQSHARSSRRSSTHATSSRWPCGTARS